MHEFIWEGKIPAPGCDALSIKVEVNCGEAMRFRPYASSAFDARGFEVERFFIDYPGIDKLSAFNVFRAEHPIELQAFVLCALVEGRSYAFSVVFSPFDAATLAQSPASLDLRNLLNVYLGRKVQHVNSTVLFRAMESFFSREDCIEDSREITLLSVHGTSAKADIDLFSHDPEAKWTTPWERIELPVATTSSVKLKFAVVESRCRVFADRIETTESVPAPDLPVRLSLPTLKDKVRTIETKTDDNGIATIALRRIGNVLRKRFVIGFLPSETETQHRPLTGYFLIRPPGKNHRQIYVGSLPGYANARGPGDLKNCIIADLKQCFDTDVDTFSDPLSREPFQPSFRSASLLQAAFQGRKFPPELGRFVRRAKQRELAKGADCPGFDSLACALIDGETNATVSAEATKIHEAMVDLDLHIWTQSHARSLLDIMCRAAFRSQKKVNEQVRLLAQDFLGRVHRETEPTFYVHNIRRPIKTFAAASEPVEPHAWAILALAALEEYLPELEAGPTLFQQMEHVVQHHGFHDALPDIVAYGRKMALDLRPLLAGAGALKVMVARCAHVSSWRMKLDGYLTETWRLYRDHYSRLTLGQRFELLQVAVPSTPPYFDDDGRLWRPTRSKK